MSRLASLALAIAALCFTAAGAQAHAPSLADDGGGTILHVADDGGGTILHVADDGGGTILHVADDGGGTILH